MLCIYFCSSGRHTRDTQSESGRSQPDVPRAASKRYPRRTISDSRLSCKLKLMEDTVRPVYKGDWRVPQNVPFLSSWPLYTGSKHIYYSINGENETALYRQWFAIYKGPLKLDYILNIVIMVLSENKKWPF